MAEEQRVRMKPYQNETLYIRAHECKVLAPLAPLSTSINNALRSEVAGVSWLFLFVSCFSLRFILHIYSLCVYIYASRRAVGP